MSEANRATAAQPEMLIGAVRLRAINIDDWTLEYQLSRDPDVVMSTYYPSDMDEDQYVDESQARAEAGLVKRYVILDQAGHALGTCGIGKPADRRPGNLLRIAADGAWPWCRHGSHEKVLATWALAHDYSKVALETVEGNAASERVARRAGFAPVDR